METQFTILKFNEISNNRMDFKYNYFHKINPIFFNKGTNVLGDCVELFVNPVRYDTSKIYKYYGSSTNAIDSNGKFIEFEEIHGNKPPSRAKQLLSENTIVITNLEGNRSMPAIVTKEEAGSVLSSAFYMLKAKSNIDIEYLKLILHSNYVQDYLCNFCSVGLNIAVATWGLDELFKIPINLPELSKQKIDMKNVSMKINTLQDIISRLEKEKEKYNLKNVIDRVFLKHVGLDVPEISMEQSSGFKISSMQNMGDRLDFNFITYKDDIEVDNDNSYTKIKNIAKIKDIPIVKKGTIRYGQNIEFKEISSYSGRIATPIEYDEYKIESDKTPFYGCDIMFSKFNPQFGKNIIVTQENEHCVGSLEFWGLELNKDKIIPQYFIYAISTRQMLVSFSYLVTGAKLILDGNGRSRITPQQFRNLQIPLPDIKVQEKIIKEIDNEIHKADFYQNEINKIQETIETSIDKYVLNGYSEDLFKLPEEVSN